MGTVEARKGTPHSPSPALGSYWNTGGTYHEGHNLPGPGPELWPATPPGQDSAQATEAVGQC